MLTDRFCFTEAHNLYRAKENMLSSAALGFATLGKRLQLFLPSNFPAFLLWLARRVFGSQPLVNSEFTVLAGRVAYLWERGAVDTWPLFTGFKGCGAALSTAG